MENKRRKIPNHLRKFRKQIGLTQRQVAALLEFSSTKRIILWEQGTAAPSMCNLFRISIIYHAFPHELYPEYFFDLKVSLLPKIEDALFENNFSHYNENSN